MYGYSVLWREESETVGGQLYVNMLYMYTTVYVNMLYKYMYTIQCYIYVSHISCRDYKPQTEVAEVDNILEVSNMFCYHFSHSVLILYTVQKNILRIPS